MADADLFAELRAQMVAEQLIDRGIEDERVLRAMSKVPRHLFVPAEVLDQAYSDKALPLGPDQSISQPYIVSLTLEALDVKSGDKVLDVGTGSGYQTALLAELGAEVFSIEIDPALQQKSAQIVRSLGYNKVRFLAADGKEGWPQHGPFERIVVSAACEEIPRPLIRQLATGGRMILPMGEDHQYLTLIEKTGEGLESKDLGAVQFVRIK